MTRVFQIIKISIERLTVVALRIALSSRTIAIGTLFGKTFYLDSTCTSLPCLSVPESQVPDANCRNNNEHKTFPPNRTKYDRCLEYHEHRKTMEPSEINLGPIWKSDIDQPPSCDIDKPNECQEMIQVEPTTPVDPRCSSRLFRRVLESGSVAPTVNQCESKHDMRNIKQVSDRPQ